LVHRDTADGSGLPAALPDLMSPFGTRWGSRRKTSLSDALAMDAEEQLHARGDLPVSPKLWLVLGVVYILLGE
jgi:hypothetical protein